MKFVNLIAFLMLFFNSTIIAQTTTAETNLKKQADQMVLEFSKGNYEAFAKFSHPKVLQLMGGEAKMVTVLKRELQKWTDDGISIQSATTGNVTKVVKAGTELHSIITQKLIMKVPGGTLTKNSHLLAISPNNGTDWYFLDTEPLDKVKVKRLFPNFNDQLVLPAKEEPVFTSSQ